MGLSLIRSVVAEYISPEEVKIATVYHDKLNPDLWEDDVLKGHVHDKLKDISAAFFEYLKLPNMLINDVVITGSMANYNWTKHSDIDLHLIVDLNQAQQNYGVLVRDFCDLKRRMWNQTHKITVYGHDVELYVQDVNEPHVASGTYSIERHRWIKEPIFQQPDVDDRRVRVKAAHLMNEIDEHTNAGCDDPNTLTTLRDKIIRMRRAGLEKAGEFSVENVVFKTLRRNGYLHKLISCRRKSVDAELSVEEEEWLKDEV